MIFVDMQPKGRHSEVGKRRFLNTFAVDRHLQVTCTGWSMDVGNTVHGGWKPMEIVQTENMFLEPPLSSLA